MSKKIHMDRTRNEGWVAVALLVAGIVVAGLAAPKEDDHKGTDKAFIDTVSFVEKTATDPCEYALGHGSLFEREGKCAPETHGIISIKSSRGMDFIADYQGTMSLIASAYDYDIDGEHQRRYWTLYPQAADDIIKAFGKAE